MPSYAAIAPIAQHRGREPQLACDLDQRPTAARQQGDRLRLELIRKMTPFLTHSTPSRSSRSLAKVSINSGEAHGVRFQPKIPSAISHTINTATAGMLIVIASSENPVVEITTPDT